MMSVIPNLLSQAKWRAPVLPPSPLSIIPPYICSIIVRKDSRSAVNSISSHMAQTRLRGVYIAANGAHVLFHNINNNLPVGKWRETIHVQ